MDPKICEKYGTNCHDENVADDQMTGVQLFKPKASKEQLSDCDHLDRF